MSLSWRTCVQHHVPRFTCVYHVPRVTWVLLTIKREEMGCCSRLQLENTKVLFLLTAYPILETSSQHFWVCTRREDRIMVGLRSLFILEPDRLDPNTSPSTSHVNALHWSPTAPFIGDIIQHRVVSPHPCRTVLVQIYRYPRWSSGVEPWVSVGVLLPHLKLISQVPWDKLKQKELQANEEGMFCDFMKVPGTTS